MFVRNVAINKLIIMIQERRNNLPFELDMLFEKYSERKCVTTGFNYWTSHGYINKLINEPTGLVIMLK